MIAPTDINRPIVEGLYAEALDLSDAIRDAFDHSSRLDIADEQDEQAQQTLSAESLRTTTRMMHALAWLLNQRAYLSGEMSEFQLRRHGRLPARHAAADPEQLRRLSPELCELVEASERFYDRLQRLDTAWRKRFVMQPTAVERVRARMGIPGAA